MTQTVNQTTRVAAYGIIRQDEKILLCRISARVPGSKGKWTLPGGGIEFGESPEQAMVREVYEETGLQARALGVAGIDSIVVSNTDNIRHGIRIIYHAGYESGELVFEQDGSTDKCEWFSQEEARNLPLVTLAQVGLDLAYR